MNKYRNVRIKDVAQIAGVSVATVDRVLHNRGKISQKALAKVADALKQTGYKPNLIASTLGSHKIYKIAALIPDPALDDYWELSGNGILKAKEDWSQYNVRIESFYFNMYKKPSFRQIAAKAMAFDPDSILIAPIFHREAIEFFNLLKGKKIPYILFNTNIPEAEPLSFIGQDLYQSGRVAAEMLLPKIGLAGPGQSRQSIAILHIYEEIQNALHLKEKERGFRDYFIHHNITKFDIHSYYIGSYGEPEFDRQLLAVLKGDNIAGIFVSTSKGTHLTASALKKYEKKEIPLVGYDLLKDNIACMNDGYIHYLINQNPKKQAFLGISYLVNYLLFKKPPPAIDLFPLEIITPENLKSYLYSGIY